MKRGKVRGEETAGGKKRGARDKARPLDQCNNSAFEQYCRGQKIVKSEEWQQFHSSLASPLPTVFRINPLSPFVEALRKVLRLRFPESCAERDWVSTSTVWQIGFDEYEGEIQSFCERENRVGSLSFQEFSSLLGPLFLRPETGHKVLDLCAAPGSKSSQLLEQMVLDSMHRGQGKQKRDKFKERGVVLANDKDVERAALPLLRNTRKVESPALIVTLADAKNFPSVAPTQREKEGDGDRRLGLLLGRTSKFDRVLADVPCSGDGTLRKNQGIWGSWKLRDQMELHPLQFKILMKGLRLLAPGGRLVYSTCSLSPIEGEAVVAAALRWYLEDTLICAVDPARYAATAPSSVFSAAAAAAAAEAETETGKAKETAGSGEAQAAERETAVIVDRNLSKGPDLFPPYGVRLTRCFPDGSSLPSWLRVREGKKTWRVPDVLASEFSKQRGAEGEGGAVSSSSSSASQEVVFVDGDCLTCRATKTEVRQVMAASVETAEAWRASENAQRVSEYEEAQKQEGGEKKKGFRGKAFRGPKQVPPFPTDGFVRPSMLPPPSSASSPCQSSSLPIPRVLRAYEEEIRESLPLCMRVLPQDNDCGGFFVAVFEKDTKEIDLERQVPPVGSSDSPACWPLTVRSQMEQYHQNVKQNYLNELDLKREAMQRQVQIEKEQREREKEEREKERMLSVKDEGEGEGVKRERESESDEAVSGIEEKGEDQRDEKMVPESESNPESAPAVKEEEKEKEKRPPPKARRLSAPPPAPSPDIPPVIKPSDHPVSSPLASTILYTSHSQLRAKNSHLSFRFDIFPRPVDILRDISEMRVETQQKQQSTEQLEEKAEFPSESLSVAETEWKKAVLSNRDVLSLSSFLGIPIEGETLSESNDSALQTDTSPPRRFHLMKVQSSQVPLLALSGLPLFAWIDANKQTKRICITTPEAANWLLSAKAERGSPPPGILGVGLRLFESLGKFLPGTSCRWRLSQEAVGMLTGVISEKRRMTMGTRVLRDLLEKTELPLDWLIEKEGENFKAKSDDMDDKQGGGGDVFVEGMKKVVEDGVGAVLVSLVRNDSKITAQPVENGTHESALSASTDGIAMGSGGASSEGTGKQSDVDKGENGEDAEELWEMHVACVVTAGHLKVYVESDQRQHLQRQLEALLQSPETVFEN
uniref:SAM-dependent MTase RsmB/NOP-type domain-containing protein n=1 Tax=Chromera velia CCMP2878 TaxID=1169474 RepID=A0A0G4I9L1_9ALVE|eukprot:Cvel_12279.t1-p1 / transcript=Cvel_12279.t1 / gene=Cvel_12279 / organism=Chromera_velia_CCMP2878 / gene_product=Multisite-specific, putative / transcript_product=Multisite-specific, putative / location=Cvel_scaffold796:52635-56758(+) / protein_length=1157 / sequence_SO=supercontig / SO=protein_coding / is_pseudo=false